MRKKTLLITILLAAILINITPALAQTGALQTTDLSDGTHTFTYQQLEEMPKTTEYAEIYCYGTLVGAGDWTGVQLSYLLSQISDGSNVNSIQFVASDAYNIVIPIDVATAPETLIAYQKNGAPLLEGLRLILPGYNGANWIAQIVTMKLSDSQVATPAAGSGSGGRSNLIDRLAEEPQPTLSPKQEQITPQPIPHTSTLNPTAPSANTVQVEPTPTSRRQTANNQSSALEFGTVVIVAALFGLSFATVGNMMFRRRAKSKDILQDKR